MKNLNLTLVPMGIALLVAGCGGGGSSSTPAPNTPAAIPTGAVKITSQNATTVAAGANKSTSTLSSTASGTSAPAGPTGAVVSASALSVMSSAQREFDAVRNLKFPAVASGAITSAALTTCTTGSGTASWNDVNNNQTFDAGDILSVTYVNCVIAGVKRNGSASFTIGATSFGVTYTGFSEVSSAETLAMDGDLTLSASTVGTLTSVSMSGTSIETNSSLNGHYKMWAPTGGVNGYSITITLDSSNNAYTYAVNMNVASTEMGGSVSIVTSPAFAGTSPANPSTGTMTITGASNTVLTLTAATATQYSVTVTENGTTTLPTTLYNW